MTSAQETVERYTYEVWNRGDLDLAGSLFADIVVRHDIGSRTEIARADNIQRIRDLRASVSALEFVLRVVIPGSDGQHVVTVWECHITAIDGENQIVSGIEVFRVIDGRITEVFNTPQTPGQWG
jgi:ketosteroid isomerase-like protein